MSNITVYPEQSNTKPGYRSYPPAADLTGHEGRLAVLSDTGLDLPTADNDLALHVLLGEQTAGTWAAQSLVYDGNIRVRAKGTGNKGDTLILAVPGAQDVDAGKVRSIPETPDAGQYFSPGISEEDFVDGQLVLIRPLPRLIHIPGDRLTTSTATDLRDEINALLEAHGLVVPA